MELELLLCVLLYGRLFITHCELLHVRHMEGNRATLHCGRLTNGKVTWSRDANGQRVDILTSHNGETTKHISDPDRRYGSGADLVLYISRVVWSDAGRYYCRGTTVELSVTPEVLHVSQTEGNMAVLYCGRLTKGSVTWSRDINGQRVDILTTSNGEMTPHIYLSDRYNSGPNLALIIHSVSQPDTGRYYCSRTTVELTVTPHAPSTTAPSFLPPESPTTTADAPSTTAPSFLHPESPTTTAGEMSLEETLPFVGVGLAFLMFLLATVAACRVVLHQARRTD